MGQLEGRHASYRMSFFHGLFSSKTLLLSNTKSWHSFVLVFVLKYFKSGTEQFRTSWGRMFFMALDGGNQRLSQQFCFQVASNKTRVGAKELPQSFL